MVTGPEGPIQAASLESTLAEVMAKPAEKAPAPVASSNLLDNFTKPAQPGSGVKLVFLEKKSKAQ